MKLNKVTITGIDERTNLDELFRVWDRFKFAEFGILVSKSREGKHNRYPSQRWIDDAIELPICIPLAGHLCGEWALNAFDGPWTWAINRNNQFKRFNRIQLYGVFVNPSSLEKIDKLSLDLGKAFVLQIGDFTPFTTEYIFPPKNKVQFLIDASGGKGLPFKNPTVPPLLVDAGYSGGIGPDNIRQVLETLTALPSDASFWIDMESGVRTDDWLDLSKVEEVLKVASWSQTNERITLDSPG